MFEHRDFVERHIPDPTGVAPPIPATTKVTLQGAVCRKPQHHTRHEHSTTDHSRCPCCAVVHYSALGHNLLEWKREKRCQRLGCCQLVDLDKSGWRETAIMQVESAKRKSVFCYFHRSHLLSFCCSSWTEEPADLVSLFSPLELVLLNRISVILSDECDANRSKCFTPTYLFQE